LATEEISIGDFVLSGGELPAMVVVDAVTRLIPGALGNEASSQNESFSAGPASRATSPQVGAQDAAPLQGETANAHGRMKLEAPTTNHVLLDFPHYTRPAEYRGWGVPEVLIGGNHAEVAKWRRAAAMEKTWRNRPDLI
jgi:tRNA (guanine37-N1)-methyltransferase